MNNPALEALTLDQLRLFAAVADEGSFSAAARKLGRAQSAVSYGLGNLEQLLGVQLFDRTGRTPVLSGEGAALLPYARFTLEQAGRLTARASAMSEGVEPAVRLAVDAICPAELLVEIARGFQRAFPSVSLRIETEVLEAVPALVLEGACHIGIAGPLGTDVPTLERRLLGHVELVPVAAPDHPLGALDDPIAASFAAGQVQIVIGQRNQSSSSEGVLSRTTWRVADAPTKLALIRAGLGWGNLPLSMVRDDIASGALRKLELEDRGSEPWRVPLWTVVAIGAALGPAAQWLLTKLGDMRARCETASQTPPLARRA